MVSARTAWLVAVLAVALAVRLTSVIWLAGQPIAVYQALWSEGDTSVHWEWSNHILAGDLLGREPYHPYVSWMQQVAPLETWERWWGGASIFHKAPLYPYLLAAERRLAGDGFLGIALCQTALGVLGVALVFLLGDRLFGLAAGTLAGLGAALYGPSLLYEPLLLRDALGATLSLLLLWQLARCEHPTWRAWMAAGMLFALALLARELTILYAPFVGLWIWQRWRRVPRAGMRACAAFVAGVLVGLLPLVARNIAVGAPPWALSAIGHEALVYGHAAGSGPAAFWIPDQAAAILRRADGRLDETIRLTLATYPTWYDLARHEAARLAAVFAAYEGMDNVSWYYFADRAPWLGWTLRWDLVIGPGLVGVWLARRHRQGDDRFLASFLLTALLGLIAVPVIGRYRLTAAAVLLIYAALTVTWLVGALRERRFLAAAGVVALGAGLVVGSRHLLARAKANSSTGAP